MIPNNPKITNEIANVNKFKFFASQEDYLYRHSEFINAVNMTAQLLCECFYDKYTPIMLKYSASGFDIVNINSAETYFNTMKDWYSKELVTEYMHPILYEALTNILNAGYHNDILFVKFNIYYIPFDFYKIKDILPKIKDVILEYNKKTYDKYHYKSLK